MKILLILTTAGTCLLAACDKGRSVSTNRESMNTGEPLPVPGDQTRDHWAPPTSGKGEGLLTDPITGTPNQKPNQ